MLVFVRRCGWVGSSISSATSELENLRQNNYIIMLSNVLCGY